MRKSRLLEGTYLLGKRPAGLARPALTHDNFTDRTPYGGDIPFKFLPYQLSMVGYRPTMVVTGNGELGFDSGEGA